MDFSNLKILAQEFADLHGLVIKKQLGYGVQGIVFSSSGQAEGGQIAIKVHEREIAYYRERNTYLRLQELQIKKIRGCNVPELFGYDDDQLVIAMTVVDRPYVLDFGGAHRDRPLDFSQEVMADWYAAKAEQFGGTGAKSRQFCASWSRTGSTWKT